MAWAGLYFGTNFWTEAHQREEDSLRAESLAREAQLRVLRHELTPHFLLNTLNGISTLVGEGRNSDARKMIASLGDLLRTTLTAVGVGDVTLEHEFLHIEQYLAIERIRLKNHLTARLILEPDAGSALVPNLLLQPLVENALHHGIGSLSEQGDVQISACLSDGRVNVAISNTFRPEKPRVTAGSKLGLGLDLTRRLTARFGNSHELEISEVDGRWLVLMTFPFQTVDEMPDD